MARHYHHRKHHSEHLGDMTKKTKIIIGVTVGVAALVGYGIYAFGQSMQGTTSGGSTKSEGILDQLKGGLGNVFGTNSKPGVNYTVKGVQPTSVN